MIKRQNELIQYYLTFEKNQNIMESKINNDHGNDVFDQKFLF